MGEGELVEQLYCSLQVVGMYVCLELGMYVCMLRC
jgi:hypothetical protein